VLCHLVPYAQGTSVYISTLTLTSIAIDRFFVIIYPFQPRMKMSTCAAIIVSIWLFSLLVTLPYGIFMSHNNRGLLGDFFYCEEAWYTEAYRKAYGAFNAVAQFVVPFCIITFCYVKVSLKLNDRAKCKPGERSQIISIFCFYFVCSNIFSFL
jgi:neuropeptide F receptor